MANKKGFTLIELLIVMVILSIMSAISWPSLSGWTKRNELKAEVSTFFISLRRAKMEAIEANSAVVIEATSRGYTIFLNNSSIPGKAGDWSRQPDERLLIDCRLKKGLTLSSNFPKNKARFNSSIRTVNGEVKYLSSRYIDLGRGAATSPTLHSGSGSGNSSVQVFSQMSTGEMVQTKAQTVLPIRAGRISWRDQ